MNNNRFKLIEINKSDLNIFTKIDIQVVSFDYRPKLGENVFLAYILDNIPIMMMSKTMIKEEFVKLVN